MRNISQLLDDASSGEITLAQPVTFYQEEESSIFVSPTAISPHANFPLDHLPL